MQNLFLLILFFFLVLIAYLLFWPVKIKVEAIDADPLPKSEGVLAPNILLSSAEPFGPRLPDGGGPEDIEFDAEGNLYTGLSNGQIIKMKADGSSYEVYAEVGGRPLGIAFDKQGNLYVANARKGLQLVTKEGEVKLLLTHAAGKPIPFASEIAIAKDGMVYLAQGSTNYTLDKIVHVLIEPTGRLLAYNPQSQMTRELLTGFHFLNGVVLSSDEDYLVFDETATGRVYRYWLKGEKAGELSIIVPSMPGAPDNITRSGNLYWVALITDRKLIDFAGKLPFLCKIFLRLPGIIFTQTSTTKKNSRIAAINSEGQIIKYLEDGKGIIPNVSSGIEKNGWLYLGSLHGNFIYRVKIT